MKYLFNILFILIYTSLYAQKQDYQWFIDVNQDGNIPVQGLLLDWNKKNTSPLQIDLPYGIVGNNASICDKDGNLLFWSNGCAVMNRQQAVMPHGDTLNSDTFKVLFNWNDCQYGYPGSQNLKILSDPGNDHGYYIIHKTWKYNGQFEDITFELRHTYVDMNLDGGLGDVVYFDSVLYHGRTTLSNLEAVYQTQSKDWWIIQPIENDSLFLIYSITDNGIHRLQDQNAGVRFEHNRSGGGTMRISPDGTKLAYYEYFLNLHVYDFDRTTGQISNHRKVIIFEDAETKANDQYRFGSVEWSPDSRMMYVAIQDSLFQIDSYEQDMNEGIKLIDVYNGTLDPFPTNFYIATLAPDCKIYICSTNGTQSYHIIHKPNELGTACQFVQNGLKLPKSSGAANLPLYPRFRVDEINKCDRTISSIFGNIVFYRRDLKVFPSPSVGIFQIEIPPDFGSGILNVLNIEGEVIYKESIARGITGKNVDITNQPSGMYHVELYPDNNVQRIFWGTEVVKI